MIINPGDKIHVITRRRFESDVRRHFVGEVIQASDVAVLAKGFAYVYDQMKSQYVRKSDRRQRVIALTDSGNIIYKLPTEVKLEKITYSISTEKHLVVTDGKSFSLDINEFRTV